MLSGWHQDPEFLNAHKAPLPLRQDGEGTTFVQLARRYCEDAPSLAVLEELLAAGATERLDDGRLLAKGSAPAVSPRPAPQSEPKRPGPTREREPRDRDSPDRSTALEAPVAQPPIDWYLEAERVPQENSAERSPGSVSENAVSSGSASSGAASGSPRRLTATGSMACTIRIGP